MKELYRKYFFVPKQGKVNEKNMMRRIALSIAVMVFCMGAMSMSAYAFVTWNVTSGVNVIKSAHFVGTVKTLSRATADETGIYTLTGGEHSFTLGHGGDATTGYYKILIDDDRNSLIAYNPDEGRDVKWTYYSKQIKEEGGDQTITIVIPDGKTAYVEFVAEWGTYSGDDAVSQITLSADELSDAVIVHSENQESDGTQNAGDTGSDQSSQPADKSTNFSDQTQQKEEQSSTDDTTKESESTTQETSPSEPDTDKESITGGDSNPDPQSSDQPSY